MTAPEALLHIAPTADVAPPSPDRRVPIGIALFTVCAIAYFFFGAVMILHYNFFDPDGISRVANAGFAVMSRDPHISAIGYVWNPLPSLIEIPVLQLSRWWPELRTAGLASVVQSSLFMAGAVVMIRRIATDRGMGLMWQRLATLAFALHPVIVSYAASGMSEAAEIFCALWATRNLLRWLKSQDPTQLALVGIALAIGYLARYEFAVCATAVAALVGLVSLANRYDSDRRMVVQRAVLNVLIAGFPIAVAFTAWAMVGWITTGDLFATLTSNYGNAGQVATAQTRGTASTLLANRQPIVVAIRFLGMQPLAGVAIALAGCVAALRRRVEPIVPICTFGSVLAFSAWGQLTGTTFGLFRYYILAIPMVIVVAMCCWQPAGTEPRQWGARSWTAKAGALLLCGALLAIPVTARAMLNPAIGNQYLQYGWRSILDPEAYPASDQWYRQLRTDDRLIASYLDAMNLPDGSVLMDTFVGWGVWLYSDNPKQFVITSDYDFADALSRPWDNHIRYVLVSNPALNDAPDAINLRWPSLWADGAGFGRLVFAAVGATGQTRWRIYEVTGPPTFPASTVRPAP